MTRAPRLPRLASLWLIAALVPLAAPDPAASDPTPAVERPARRHPDAPPETDQFGFLIGTWDCTTRSMGPDGQLGPVGKATWTGYYILDGWAIQDDWIGERPDGSRVYGTNIRSFNPENGYWDNRWLAQGNLRWVYFRADRVDDTMVMVGGEGEDARGAFIDRNVFYDIGADAWKWRKDRSWDGGESWLEGVAHIEARRRGARPAAPPTPASPTTEPGADP